MNDLNRSKWIKIDQNRSESNRIDHNQSESIRIDQILMRTDHNWSKFIWKDQSSSQLTSLGKIYKFVQSWSISLIAGSVSTTILAIVFSPELLSSILTGKTCKSAGLSEMIENYLNWTWLIFRHDQNLI